MSDRFFSAVVCSIIELNLIEFITAYCMLWCFYRIARILLL